MVSCIRVRVSRVRPARGCERGAERRVRVPPRAAERGEGGAARAAALKEGAPAVAALRRGAQLVVLQRGGVREPRFAPPPRGALFALLANSFHAADVCAAARAELGEGVVAYEHKGRETLDVPALAQCVDAYVLPMRARDGAGGRGTGGIAAPCVSPLSLARALAPWHVYEPEAFAERRLASEPQRDVTVLVLRCYALRGVSTSAHADTWGCRSWAGVDREPLARALGACARREDGDDLLVDASALPLRPALMA
eukprot:PRCOL_00006208-RA